MVAASVVFLRYGLTGAAVCSIAACVRGRRRLATTGFFRCACVIRYHLLHLPVDNILATLSFRVNEGEATACVRCGLLCAFADGCC